MLQHTMMRVLTALWHVPHFAYLGIATAGYAWVRRRWALRQQRLLTEMSKNWPIFRGRVVAVQAVRDGNEDKKGKWAGLLTYSYIADEVEIGEYRQPFDSEEEADDWVRALRDRVIKVAVDPKDQRRSIWLAEEADATRKAAQIERLNAKTAELPVWLEAVRTLTLAVAVGGAATSFVIEVRELMVIFGHAAATNRHMIVVLFVGACLCSGVASYILGKRFPGGGIGDMGRRFSSPTIRVVLKIFGLIEGTLAFTAWLGFGEDGHLLSHLTSSGYLSAISGGLLGAASVALWVCGERLPVQHELAPQMRGRPTL